MRWGRWATIALLAFQLAPAWAEQSLVVPSLDAPKGQPVQLPGYWFAAPGQTRAPAWVLLHGCGGPYDRRGVLSKRMRDYAALLNAQGMHALVLDSLTPRGESELCTQRTGTRAVTQTQRRRDALGALQWLAARADVDVQRLGLMGWSNGGSTVLAASNRVHSEVQLASVHARYAVAFYPGCVEELQRGYQPSGQLLMLLGQADDWTPAAPCEALAQQSLAPKPQLESYPDAYHGFDGEAKLRLRTDVPNGSNPGQGVHVGANPAAREASRRRLQQYLRDMKQGL